MKVKSILLNLSPLILYFVHAVIAKYDILHYMMSARFAIFIVIVLPTLCLFLNYKASKDVFQLVLLNIIFLVTHIIGGCIYDLILVKSISDGGLMVMNSTIIYMVIASVILCIKKKRKLNDKSN